jgi:hypothetical protein
MWGESGEFIQGVQNATRAENKSQTFVDFFGPKNLVEFL